jgi:hypothetical protein
MRYLFVEREVTGTVLGALAQYEGFDYRPQGVCG